MNVCKVQRSVVTAATGGGLLIGLLVVLSGTSRVARADPDVLFVSPTGSGSACSRSVPCDLQTGLSQSVNGDTVYLGGGTYTGSGGAVISLTKSIDLRGGWDGSASGPLLRDADTYMTTLDGQGQRRVAYISGSGSPTLDGLHLTNGSTTGQGGGVHATIGSHTTLSNC
jgi:hypothetical protein